MTMAERALKFVKSLELEDLKSFAGDEFKTKQLFSQANAAEGLVVASCLVSFSPKVTKQQKEDVIDSILLAKLASRKRFKYDDKKPKDWYNFYSTVLNNIGWDITKFTFNEHTVPPQKTSFKISDTVLEMMSQLTQRNQELMKIMGNTIEALKGSDDGQKLFYSNSISPSERSINFQIVVCTADKAGQLEVFFLGSYLVASEAFGRHYFFDTIKNTGVSWLSSTAITQLNQDIYNEVRDEIKKKLGNKVIHMTVHL